jgi:hypothetical protein
MWPWVLREEQKREVTLPQKKALIALFFALIALLNAIEASAIVSLWL